ncbi:hypothetical protein POV27_06820 [Aureisphaera galaxeae]|uniref:hypothetical protein n=1 Tax=Aureisphaera galaxeae TaxID=1538023 RepID=UPI00235002FD|nr:hypothetical protein [Aureisphaera galaxeae]MDC8003756.1 hypothetical protein [Aureisphaera galaxeae]
MKNHILIYSVIAITLSLALLSFKKPANKGIDGETLSTSTIDEEMPWNLPAKNINALRFLKNGEIHFTLFNEGNSGAEFRCSSARRGQWFVITPCDPNDNNCRAAVEKMGNMLLSAKLAGKKVHVQRSACECTEIALKPN